MIKILILTIFSSFLLSCSKNVYQYKEQHIKFKNTGRHISVNLKVNQYGSGNFYFDTGSPWFVIDSTFYKKQKMTFNKYAELEVTGAGSNKTKMIRVLDTIKFSADKKKFFSNKNLVFNLKDIHSKDIDGIVGFGNFDNVPFKVDYSAQKIILNPKINDNYQEGTIKFDDNFMYIPLNLKFSNEINIEGDFLIDTGSNKTVLTSEFVQNMAIINSKKEIYVSNGGVGGLSTGYSLFIPEIKINKYKITTKQINISTDSLGALSKNKTYIGIIGNDILDDFDIIYYPTRNKIWLKSNKNFNEPSDDLYKPFTPIEKSNDDEGWIVVTIYENSDAYQKGLRHKDEIVEINNKLVKKINLQKWNNQLKPNQKLKLKVKRGNKYFEIDTYLNVFLKKND